jgi:DNA-binding XRE family transcriptional regulator
MLDIKRLRALKKITQAELAKKINVTRQTIIRWEDGKSKPDEKEIMEMSKVFGMDISKMYAGVSSDEKVYSEKDMLINYLLSRESELLTEIKLLRESLNDKTKIIKILERKLSESLT